MQKLCTAWRYWYHTEFLCSLLPSSLTRPYKVSRLQPIIRMWLVRPVRRDSQVRPCFFSSQSRSRPTFLVKTSAIPRRSSASHSIGIFPVQYCNLGREICDCGVLFVRWMTFEYNNIYAACPNLSHRTLSGLLGTSTHCIYSRAESCLTRGDEATSIICSCTLVSFLGRNEGPSSSRVSLTYLSPIPSNS